MVIICFDLIIECFQLNDFSQVLEDMEMLSAFTAILHVPNLSKPEHVLAVLEEYDLFNKSELNSLAKKMSGQK